MSIGAVAVAIFSKDGSRLFHQINSSYQRHSYDIELFFHCSLDIVDDKLTKTNEMYLGHLYGDPKYKSFGYVTNSGVCMILVVEASHMTLKDQDVRAFFKKLHSSYCSALANPFYVIGAELKSSHRALILIVLKMDEGFSGMVRISNISDYIAPSSNCIIPLNQNTIKTKIQSEIVIRNKQTKDEKDAIKISLNDCLACSGCITSAETVLVQEQSLSRLIEGLPGKLLSVVTVSPQTVCSIASKRSISIPEATYLITSYFLSIGVTYIVDSSFGRLISLKCSVEEFISSKTRPILASACPGFVCYAEKTHGKLLTPLISRVRSPQAIHGALVKDYLSRQLNIPIEYIYHATVMPCFDKKLEASRSDFTLPGTSIRETDCVISTVEIDSVLDSTVNFDVSTLPEGWLGNFGRGMLIGKAGTSTSGGFGDYIVNEYQSQTGAEIRASNPAKNLAVVEVINADTTLIRVAQVYGFRNIQNFVRKLKSGKCPYDYIEIMACPGGCAAGGGQLRGATTSERESILQATEKLYQSIDYDGGEELQRVLEEWRSLNPEWQSFLYTDYHIVESMDYSF